MAKASDNLTKEQTKYGSFKYQLNLFFLAVSFFTRIPVPKSTRYSAYLLNCANRYFSLVGLFLGLVLASVYLVLGQVFPVDVAIIITMIISVLLTGAFHEDGLADMADGIGGAFEVSRRLEIMKDSRLGTYGAITLMLALLLKFQLLVNIAHVGKIELITTLVLASSLSRAFAASLISTLPYVSEVSSSKSKPLANKQTVSDLLMLFAIGLIPLLLFSWLVSVALLCVLMFFQLGFSRWLKSRIGGFTGDCLGAAQQINELLIYLVVLAFLY